MLTLLRPIQQQQYSLQMDAAADGMISNWLETDFVL